MFAQLWPLLLMWLKLCRKEEGEGGGGGAAEVDQNPKIVVFF